MADQLQPPLPMPTGAVEALHNQSESLQANLTGQSSRNLKRSDRQSNGKKSSANSRNSNNNQLSKSNGYSSRRIRNNQNNNNNNNNNSSNYIYQAEQQYQNNSSDNYNQQIYENSIEFNQNHNVSSMNNNLSSSNQQQQQQLNNRSQQNKHHRVNHYSNSHSQIQETNDYESNSRRRYNNVNNVTNHQRSFRPSSHPVTQNINPSRTAQDQRAVHSSNAMQPKQQQHQQSNRQMQAASSANKINALNANQTRSEILVDQLRKNKCECMVCYTHIRNDQAIWQCVCCFHIFHLSCIKKWAIQPLAKISELDADASKWRCPGCQTILEHMPNKSTCFCSKRTNPEQRYKDETSQRISYLKSGILPHSCGEVCGKSLSQSAKFWSTSSSAASSNQQQKQVSEFECKHKCVEICHPGPCGTCESLVNRSCKCGKSKFQVKCSSSKAPACMTECAKILNCGVHACTQVCHTGACLPCDIDVELCCFSHSTPNQVKCGSAELSRAVDLKHSCGLKCGNLLYCGRHKCEQPCHQGECQSCALTPGNLMKCPCGKTAIKELLIAQKLIRTTCTDSVPTCEKKCERILPCNENAHAASDNKNMEVHLCQAQCHQASECPPCEASVEIRCRCRRETKMIKCCEQRDDAELGRFLCERRCQKKKSCGKHVCNELCCPNAGSEHICMNICNKALACGSHRCEELCHKGACRRCLVASFDERICHCGHTIQYPPIRCGTLPLECPHQCMRAHDCEHPVDHNCHWNETGCPPCSYLTWRVCMGEHETRYNIPCHMRDVSCGRTCNKQLRGCGHRCVKICHKADSCLLEGERCTQPCNKERPHCSHKCNAPCHPETSCPDTVCLEPVTIRCKCGFKTQRVKCMQKMYESSTQVVFENLASQLKEMLTCKSIDLNSFQKTEVVKKKLDVLECDEECLLNERSRALAQALQIDPDSAAAASASTASVNNLSNKPRPVYTEFLRSFTRDDLKFVLGVEKRLEALVAECRSSGKKSTSANMPIMKVNERRFIHELAGYYEIETQSYDPEPYRNVCLYAHKDKSSVPSVLLSQSLELSSSKALPSNQMSRVLNLKQINESVKAQASIRSNMKPLEQEIGYLKLSSAYAVLAADTETFDPKRLLAAATSTQKSSASNSEKVIDYFDMTE